MARAGARQKMGKDQQDLLASLAVAVAVGYQTLALAADSGKVEDVGGAVCWYSSSHVPLFNGAGLFSDDLLNADTVGAIEEYYLQRGHPFCLVTLDGLVSDACERLRELDYVEFDTNPAMVLQGPPSEGEAETMGLWVAHVQTPQEMRAFRSVLSRVFAISHEEINLILGDSLLGATTLKNYVGWLHGEPVVTATLVLSGPMAGVWNVGTLANYRRRGLGTEIMRYLITDAARLGYPTTMLLSSSEGLPLYERLGYEMVSTVRMFARAVRDTELAG